MFKRNTAVVGFGIGHFIQTADGAAKTTGTPTCKRTLDGTGGACANAASYNTDGAVWEIDLAAGDMDGDVVILSFTLADCIPISYTIRTTTVLLSDVPAVNVTYSAGVATAGRLAEYADLAALATAAALAVVDGIVDDILVDTGTTLPATLATIDGIVDDILVDTGTTLPATLATIDGIVDDILVDTGTTLPATLATIEDFIDTEVAAIKAKTDLISASGSVSVTSAISGSTITITRGDSLSVAIATLGDISSRSKLWFTVKVDTEDADTSAIIQIEETAGLVRLNMAAGTAALGDITVTDENAGNITITLDETATDDLVPRKNMSYDVQMLTSTGTVTTLTSGTLHVVADVTRAVA